MSDRRRCSIERLNGDFAGRFESVSVFFSMIDNDEDEDDAFGIDRRSRERMSHWRSMRDDWSLASGDDRDIVAFGPVGTPSRSHSTRGEKRQGQIESYLFAGIVHAIMTSVALHL